MQQPNNTSTMNQLKGKLAVVMLKLVALLPLPLNHKLGGLIGQLAWLLNSSAKKVTLKNLSLCYPDLDQAELEQLARKTLVETGKSMTEIARIWCKPDYAVQHYLCAEEGVAPLQECVQQGQPAVILAPHLGCWEILNYWLSTHFDMHVLFKPSTLEALDQLILKSREHFDTTAYPTTARGLAGLIRAIKKGATTAILPDQVPDTKGGIFVNFFGQPALTGTLSPKLLQQTGAKAFFCWGKRLPNGRGFKIIVREAMDADIYNEDLAVATQALSHCVEQLVEEDTSQYQWAYKRFKKQPEGMAKPY